MLSGATGAAVVCEFAWHEVFRCAFWRPTSGQGSFRERNRPWFSCQHVSASGDLREASQSTSVQFSGCSHGFSRDTLRFEDVSARGEVFTILGHAEDRDRVIQESVHTVLFFPLVTVEDPFVDLEPREASLLFGLLADVLWHSAAERVEHAYEETLLLGCFSGPVAKGRIEVTMATSASLSGDQ